MDNNLNETKNETEKSGFDLFGFLRHFIIPPLRKYYDKLLPFYNKIGAEKWSYLFFGALTTVVSLVSFFIADKVFHLHEQLCNAVSFVLAVAFAYFVNKYFVFNSRKKGMAALYEAVKFVGARLASYGIESAMIAVFVTWLRFDASLIKFIAQVVVFILNYVFSKLIVFTTKKNKGGASMFDKLNGYWEEGYYYYIEIRDGKLTLREYSKRIVLSTDVTVKEEDGGVIRLTLKDNKLSYGNGSNPYAEITELYYKDGQLFLGQNMYVIGEKKYVLKKTENGPFDNIVILDDELLPAMQGEWLSTDGGDKKVVIDGDKITLYYGKDSIMMESRIHIIEYKTSPGTRYIVSSDLTERAFGGFSHFRINGMVITTQMMICDAPSPVLSFSKKGSVPHKTPTSPLGKDGSFFGMKF